MLQLFPLRSSHAGVCSVVDCKWYLVGELHFGDRQCQAEKKAESFWFFTQYNVNAEVKKL
jgi:hypothetical protein